MSIEKASILFVDDERPVLNALKRLFRPTGHKVHIAGSGSEGLSVLAEHPVDIVVSDMRMPEMDGAEFLTNVAEKWPSTTRMLLTGYAELSSAIEAINSGSISRYLTKPWQDSDIVFCIEQAIETQRLVGEKQRLEQLTADQNEELKALNDGLETKVRERTQHLEEAKQELAEAHTTLKDSFDATIEVFSRLVQSRSSLSSRVSVAQDARAVGEALGLDKEACAAIYQAGLLCDVGKLTLPDKSVATPYVDLDVKSQREYHRHPIVAEATLLSLDALAPAARIIRNHCERTDGSGFPDKLSGEEIPLPARILAVTKAFADLQDGRIYEERMTAAGAQEFLGKEKGKRYDPEVVDAFLKWLKSSKRKADEVQERKVGLGSLRPGVAITRDLCDSKDVLVLAAGQTINQSILDRLVKLQDALEEEFVVYIKG